MTTPSESYHKVHYELRPAKQVERRMLIDAFQRMAGAGLQLRDYQYTGFGSIYFVDFILLHRLFGISRLLSVEYSELVRKRVHFNKPYDLVQIEIGPVHDVIPSLNPDLRHILWLDYDDPLLASHLEDLVLACTRLPPGSILLITVDVEPPVDPGKPKDWYNYYCGEAEEYLDIRWKPQDFGQTLLVRRNIDILTRAIARGISGRGEVTFCPLFNFLYADGHQMLTIGGMICTGTEERLLAACDFARVPFIRTDFSQQPFAIRVPTITRKERLYLDAAMPCADGWTPDAFEMDAEKVMAYRDIYRFYPAYAETLL